MARSWIPARAMWYESSMLSADPVMRRSQHLSTFAHMGDVYLYHDLYGYIMKMSPDVLAFLDAFAEPIETAVVCERYKDAFSGQSPAEFVDIFSQFACLVEPDEDEIEGIFYMVPVKSKWNVWIREPDDTLTIHTAWGERDPVRHTLTPEETVVWDAIDGEKRLNEMRQEIDADLVRRVLPRLTHHDVQAVKLSAFPMSTYKGRKSMRPPYILSTMPYAPYRPGDDLAATGQGKPADSPRDYYRHQVADADAQFDHRETTLSHLLRLPHPALAQRTYGEALVDALIESERLPSAGPVRALEIGAGLGYVARDVLDRTRERGLDLNYEIVELSPALAAAQKTRLEGVDVTYHHGDILEIELPEARYDFVLANEMVGDLPVVELTRQEIGFQLPPDSPEKSERLAALGETGQLIQEFGLKLDDVPETFYLNTGAYRMVERLFPAMVPGGVAIITEFGELNTYPRLSTQLDHPEYSIHFGHLTRVAESVGFEVAYEFIIDLLDFDRDLEGMVTTRSYFRALRLLLRDEFGIDLKKIGYTRQMFEALTRHQVGERRFGDVYFDRIEDRLMGLVPHEFKALILRRPA